MKRNRRGDSLAEGLKQILNPPSSSGRWGDLSDLDPRWVYEQSQPYLERVEYIDLTEEDRIIASEAFEHLPADLRPSLDHVGTHIVWSEQYGLAVLTKVDEDIVEIVSIELDQTQSLSGIIRLNSRTKKGSVALYRLGERVTLPW
jgi:hypothetical protein